MRVRRLTCSEHVAVVCPGGAAWEVAVCEVLDGALACEVVGALEVERVPRLTLVQGVSRGERMTLSVRQATELGVCRIIPFLSERSVVRIAAGERATKGERFRKVAVSAAKQSGRAVLPAVDDPCGLAEVVAALAGFDRVVVAWEEADVDSNGRSLSVADALAGCDCNSQVAVVIGPEGGLSPAEVAALRELPGCRVVTLGSLILRTETASTVAVALASFVLGGLGADGCAPAGWACGEE